MLIPRVTVDGFVFLVLLNLLILLPVDSFSKEQKLFFAEAAPDALKKPALGKAPGRFRDAGGKPGNITRKPDIVLNDSLRMSLKEVIAHTLKRNVSIAVQNFQSQIRKEEIITQEAEFDPSVSIEANTNQQRNLAASAFAQPSKSNTNFQKLDFGFSQKLKTGTAYELKFENQRSETNSTFAGLNPQYTNRFELNLTQPLQIGRAHV